MRPFLVIALAAYFLSSTAFIAYLGANTHAGYVLGVTMGIIDVPEITPFHEKTVVGHMRRDRNLAPGKIVFLGDSHILGLDVAQISRDGVNFAIGGETTAGLLARIDLYQSVRKARTIVIGIGYNDIGLRDNRLIIQNISNILSHISVPVALCGVLPVSPTSPDSSAEATKKNDVINSINVMLRSICTKNCVYIDVETIFSDQSRRAFYYEKDGVHLNKKGYNLWTALISNVINEL